MNTPTAAILYRSGAPCRSVTAAAQLSLPRLGLSRDNSYQKIELDISLF
jgi:hypothetical protein